LAFTSSFFDATEGVRLGVQALLFELERLAATRCTAVIALKSWDENSIAETNWFGMSGWQYKREDGEVVGILSEDEIKRCAERGGIALDSPVMHVEKTKGQWVPAKRIKPLRRRIEADLEQRAAESRAANPPKVTGYVPPRPSPTSKKQLNAITQGVQRGAVSLIQSVTSIAVYLTAKKPLHTCLKCEAEFSKYEILGKCPLCGEWAIVACEICGLESGAKRFVENDCKCPRCGGKVTV